ncbi:NAD(P)-dependent oxidoreductase [Tsukamurella paurometabola]|uniref:NAD-dependent epimerase/dehydratase n=2 Tax=Tsukamurella paurometabola TaxID=2061 RepID=D5UQX5_TSUPD|nr:NAD(P)H-binding protein [Tsukamurella paurometabola]ADG78964.1 NAD-dependent epimerase/dehydratase [Tsukamurella paurometabola DSM 20162]SUP33635.1 Putative NADH-flavin reductase [Tsukamurella paurometabola]
MVTNGIRRVCVVGASGKLGRYLVEHALDRGYQVTGVCRERSVDKLADIADRITIIPGDTDDRTAIAAAVSGCDAVLTVLAPWGVRGYSSGTARAVLDLAESDARLIFSCGWHVARDKRDRYPRTTRLAQAAVTRVLRAIRVMDIDDQVAAAHAIFASNRRWTLARGSTLEEGPSEGLPVWAESVGDPLLAMNRTRRIDYALFMIEALDDDALIGRAPAIVSRRALTAAVVP